MIERNDVRKALGLLCMMACFCTVPGAYAQDKPNIDMKAPNIDEQDVTRTSLTYLTEAQAPEPVTLEPP